MIYKNPSVIYNSVKMDYIIYFYIYGPLLNRSFLTLPFDCFLISNFHFSQRKLIKYVNLMTILKDFPSISILIAILFAKTVICDEFQTISFLFHNQALYIYTINNHHHYISHECKLFFHQMRIILKNTIHILGMVIQILYILKSKESHLIFIL